MTRRAFPTTSAEVRLAAARALAWAIYLGAWIGLGNLLQAIASGPLAACAWLAGWLAGTAAFGFLLDRISLSRAVMRGLLLAGAGLGGVGAWTVLHAGGVPALLATVLGFALLTALSRAVVHALWTEVVRDGAALHLHAASPIRAALLGAALAWLAAGDLADLRGSCASWIVGALAASALLALLLRDGIGRQVARSTPARFGPPACAWPAWLIPAWRSPRDWPLQLASLAMLPMMCSLPLMVGLCREIGLPGRVTLGLHLAAMFVPALCLAGSRSATRAAPVLCALLLVGAAATALWLPGALAGSTVAWLQGAAWGLAWACSLGREAAGQGQRVTSLAVGKRLAGAGDSRNESHAPLAGALVVMAFGWSLSSFGLAAVEIWPIALGTLAALAALALLAERWRALPGTRRLASRVQPMQPVGHKKTL